MTTDYFERIDRAMRASYGLFTPDSEARAIRQENARLGFKTCWHCLDAYRPERVLGSHGEVHHFGRGRFYCSKRCARAARAADALQHSVVHLREDEMLVLDPRYCPECPE